MSSRKDPVTGDFIRDESGKIKRFKPRYFRCRTCGARHHQDIPTKACLDKQRGEAETPVVVDFREGTLRLTREDGSVHTAEPGSMWFSTLTMAAQEILMGGEWVRLDGD